MSGASRGDRVADENTISEALSRRTALKQLGVVGAGLMLGRHVFRGGAAGIMIGGKPVEIEVRSLSAVTVRVIVRPVVDGVTVPLPVTGELAEENGGKSVGHGRDSGDVSRVRAGDLVVRFTDGPPTLHIDTVEGAPVQRLVFDANAPGMSFRLPTGPLLGLGEGGPQFDRKSSSFRMVAGQGGYQLRTHGTRAPIPWLIGTDGWAMFIHQPTGAFDLTDRETGRFTPRGDAGPPFDLFVVSSNDPMIIMREYARITGLPEFPARWTLGYMQSHRTLSGAADILAEARTFREKKLPCDAMIYLGTEFAPSGWNTRNGEFTWHPTNFPDPKGMVDKLHDEHFKVVLHIVVEGRHLTGTVHDPCTMPQPSGRDAENHWPRDRQVACYWPHHKTLMDAGADGWWPDQGDGFDGPSELNRHRMYWEGPQLYRPNERPFALHRNASPGSQRYGGFIWSGDVASLWQTLATHVSVAINTGLSGLPYWGTDIGGFNPTPEYTGELHVRWFQFGAFCPAFRAHGRNWHLKLPWGWDGGDGGPPESRGFSIDPAELHNRQVEPICRKYLELRYRLLPYIYTAMRESHDTGLPMMRALWLHYPDDPTAIATGDAFLWGRDILVAPVVEKGATSRRVYLPRGRWFDFWTEAPETGGRQVDRAVDLETTPLYVRAGAVIPMGPVKQYADEPSDEPMTLVVYPGADGASSWYEDDGRSFAYRTGDWMRVLANWSDARRTLSLRFAPGSRMRPPAPRPLLVRVAGSHREPTRVTLTGGPLEIRL